ncbi:MAG TPA: hypothetical protein VJC14_01365 [Candidatus Paceibacterota bacterium]
MDPESKKLLTDTLALTQENNSMLHDMKRTMRWQRIMSFVYWIFIVGSAVGAYYLIQPYVDSLMSAYGSASEALKSLKNIGQ